MANRLYSIKINSSGRYVRYCDDCWYETCESEFPFFKKEQALKIREQLRKHYVYSVTISNGEETLELDSPLKEKKAAATPVGATMCSEDENLDWTF